MTDYNDGQWHNWNGGPCPVHEKSVVDVVWHGTESGLVGILERRQACEFQWPQISWDQVIRFRVVKAHREPREWWMNVYDDDFHMVHETREDADGAAGLNRIECIRVREVLEGEE